MSPQGVCSYPRYHLPGPGGPHANPTAQSPHNHPAPAPHDWNLKYNPAGADGRCRILVTLDGRSSQLDLKEGEKAAGAEFDHFGIITTWIDGNGQNVYFDDLTYTLRQ